MFYNGDEPTLVSNTNSSFRKQLKRRPSRFVQKLAAISIFGHQSKRNRFIEKEKNQTYHKKAKSILMPVSEPYLKTEPRVNIFMGKMNIDELR